MTLAQQVQQADTVGPVGVALIGAASAVLGGLLTGGASLLGERSRRKRDDRIADDAVRRELRQAVRIVLEELHSTKVLIVHTAKIGETWQYRFGPQAKAWDRYRDALAGRVSDEAWQFVATSYRNIARLNQDMADADTSGGNPLPSTLGDRAALTALRDPFLQIHWAMGVLENELGPKAGVFHYTGYASGEEIWPEGGLPH